MFTSDDLQQQELKLHSEMFFVLLLDDNFVKDTSPQMEQKIAKENSQELIFTVHKTKSIQTITLVFHHKKQHLEIISGIIRDNLSQRARKQYHSHFLT